MQHFFKQFSAKNQLFHIVATIEKKNYFQNLQCQACVNANIVL